MASSKPHHQRGTKIEQYVYEKPDGSRMINMWGMEPELFPPGTKITEIRDRIDEMKVERAKNRGTSNAADKPNTFDEAWEKVKAILEDLIDVDEFAEGTLYDNYVPRYEKYIAPAFGKRKLNSLKHDEIRDWSLKLRASGKGLDKKGKPVGLANSTVHGAETVLRRILTEARFKGWTKNDPFARLRAGDLAPTGDGSFEKKDALEPHQVMALLRELGRLRIAIILMAFTGCRPNELCGLLWENVDFFVDPLDEDNHGELRFVQQPARRSSTRGGRRKLKSKHSVRRLPLDRELAELLIEQLAVEQAKGLGRPKDPVFSRELAGEVKPVTREMLREAVVAAAGKAALPPTTSKDLRAAICTTLALHGVADTVAAARTGHSVEVFHAHYVKPQENAIALRAAEEKRRAAGYRLDGIGENIGEPIV